jgi:peptidoglycan/xylan/chitin deacetylase (PgdA/CDA1 family)
MSSEYAKSRKKRPFPFFKILIVLLLIFNGIGLTMAQAKTSKISSENNSLQNEIQNVKTETEKLLSENTQLSKDIKDKETAYKEASKNLKVAYLTFDDGPSKNTEEILSILKTYNAKATFFVIGSEKYKAEYTKILQAGHKIALHTYTHDYAKVYTSVDSFKQDVNHLKDYLKTVTGEEPENLLRYPGGSNNTVSHKYGGNDIMKKIIDAMKADKYVYYDWNVDSTDASGNNIPKATLVSSVLNGSKNKKSAIILMHDTNAKDTTVQALPEIIQGLIAQGFTFDSLSMDTQINK